MCVNCGGSYQLKMHLCQVKLLNQHKVGKLQNNKINKDDFEGHDLFYNSFHRI